MTLLLDANGLLIETLQEVRDGISTLATDPLTGISPDLDTSDEAILGRLFGVMAEREESLQQQILAVYTNLGVDAVGVGLQRVALLTGTVAHRATYSTALLSLSLNAGVTVPAGSQVASSGDENVVFATDVAVTNGTASPAVFVVQATSIADGPVQALAATLTSILDPVSGWTAVTNAAATLGKDAESDVELRIRRVTELNRAASANLVAIVTDVRGVPDVDDVRGYENTTASTNAAGMPPHSFEIVVWAPGVDNDAVAQAIWDAQPAGIAAVFGGVEGGTAQSGDAVDVEGIIHPITFTAASQTVIFVKVDLTKNALTYPVDGDDQIASAIANAINAFGRIGRNVLASKLYAAVYAISGVIDADIRVGVAPSPSGTSVSIDSRYIGRASAVDVDVTSIDGEP